MVKAKTAIDAEDVKKAKLYIDNAKAKKKSLEAKRGKIKFEELTTEEIQELLENYDKNKVLDIYKKLRKETSTLWKKLTDEEKRIVTKYTQTYSYLNEPLRGLKYYGERPKIEFDNDLPILTSILSKQSTTKAMVVRRGTGDFYIPQINKNLSNIEVGEKFIDKAFLSTTACHRVWVPLSHYENR